MAPVASHATDEEARRLARQQSHVLFVDTMVPLYRRFKRRHTCPLRDSPHQGPDFVEDLVMEVGGEVRIVEHMGLTKGLFDKLMLALMQTLMQALM